MARITLCLIALCSTACSSEPPVIAADTGCIWAKHIDVTTFQVDEMKKAPGTWRPLAIQIADQNAARAKVCT